VENISSQWTFNEHMLSFIYNKKDGPIMISADQLD
jgi:hypothetical protein